MKGIICTVSIWGGLICGGLTVVGCAGWKEKGDQASVADAREDRAAEAIRSFEERRDSAQYQAALDRWKQGDTKRAEEQLTALVARRPDLSEARLRLAEVLWARGERSAEAHFRGVIVSDPNRAEAYHGLGLLLDALGRGDEARQHLMRAAELEPANETYQATLKTLAVPVTGGVSG